MPVMSRIVRGMRGGPGVSGMSRVPSVPGMPVGCCTVRRVLRCREGTVVVVIVGHGSGMGPNRRSGRHV